MSLPPAVGWLDQIALAAYDRYCMPTSNGGGAMRPVHFAISLIVTLVLAISACAPGPPSAPTTGAPASEAPKVTAPKRIVAAVRGDPRTLSEAINFASGGSSPAGVAENEQLLNAGTT